MPAPWRRHATGWSASTSRRARPGPSPQSRPEGARVTISLDWDRRRGADRGAAVSGARLGRWLQAGLARPGLTFVFLAGILLLGAIVVYPVVLLFRFGLTDAAGIPTLSHVAAAFAQRGILKAALNSALLGLLVTAGCLALGLPTAWLAARTDMR